MPEGADIRIDAKEDTKMKKLMFIVSLVFCLFCTPLVGLANPTEEEKAKYEEAISEKYIEMLKGSIALDKSNAELTTYLVTWLEAPKQPKEAKKLVEKIDTLKAEQAKNAESMDPYLQAKKTCDEKCNAEGANAALENIIRIQKNRLKDQEEIAKIWKQVVELLK